MCEEFGVSSYATTPAADNLFKISEDQAKLNKDGKDRLHRSVAQSLYLATRVRPDILLPITFLCSRVSEPTTTYPASHCRAEHLGPAHSEAMMIDREMNDRVINSRLKPSYRYREILTEHSN